MRKLPQELRNRFDNYFRGSRLDLLSPNQLLLKTAESMIGVNSKTSETIDFIRQTVAHPWGEPWCVDFIQTCVAYVEEIKGIQSPLIATESVIALWDKTTLQCLIQSPLPGDIIVWQLRDLSGVPVPFGHCGIISEMDSLLYTTVEGNTSEGPVSLVGDRNGNGVFRKKRAKGGTKTFNELGFLRCFI